VLLLAAVAALSPTHDPWEIGMIALLGILQIAESKIAFVETTPGKVTWILLQIAIGYVLIGYTGGIVSSYYLFLLFPVFSAATALGVFGTLLFSLLSCGAYLSFVLYLDPDLEIAPDQWRVLVLRLLFIALAGNLVNALANALREQNIRYRHLTEELAEANRNLRQAEAAMRRSDRLAALGQLSAGLAHELRNPLGTIKASAEMLSRNVSPENEVAAEMAGFISSEVDRTNSLVTRFLDFARPLSLRKNPADVTQSIDRAIQQVMREQGMRDDSGVKIEVHYSPDLGPIPMDSEMMEHVFYNLLLNAVQASANNTPVTVKTKRCGATAEISVIDHGSGIDPAMSETIFNPFVTTKPNGVGLGLPIVAKIVDEHGGKLTVESEPGKGSTFHISLPISLPLS
jgi:two-component system, NtrC family, sensor histidine kinase HydH